MFIPFRDFISPASVLWLYFILPNPPPPTTPECLRWLSVYLHRDSGDAGVSVVVMAIILEQCGYLMSLELLKLMKSDGCTCVSAPLAAERERLLVKSLLSWFHCTGRVSRLLSKFLLWASNLMSSADQTKRRRLVGFFLLEKSRETFVIWC